MYLKLPVLSHLGRITLISHLNQLITFTSYMCSNAVQHTYNAVGVVPDFCCYFLVLR